MSNGIDKYLGPHNKLGPGSYEIGAVRIKARQQPFIEFGGGYNSWGLNEGPRRGEGGPSTIREVAKPNVMAEFLNEQIFSQAQMDRDYTVRFSTLSAETERELKARIHAAKGTQTLTPAESVVLDQKVVLDFIESKKKQYTELAPKIYGLYGQSPYFLMTYLARQKIHVFLHSDNNGKPREALIELYALFETVYKSAMELKVLSLSTSILATQLAQRALQREQAQGVGNDTALYQRLEIVAQEQNIHAQQLPEFLQAELVTAAGSVAGLKPSHVLTHYKTTLERMAASKTAAIRPIVGPPSYARGGITYTPTVHNPKINAPLSPPELQALNELVNLQNHSALGTKWLTYHDALLKTESTRHLMAAANAFGGLAERASHAEQLIDAKLLADEQARTTEAIRVANTFRAPGSASATSPLFMTSAGAVAVIDAAPATLQAAIRSAIAVLSDLAVGTASGLVVGVSALVYSPKLANGELPERYAFSTPLSDLAPLHEQDLSAIAAANGSIDLPVRISSKTAADGQSEVFVATTDGVVIPSKVRVVAATFNQEKNVYSVTTSDIAPRTLMWTPIVSPGNSSTASPAEPPAPTVYTGVTVTPVVGRIDTFPGLVEAGFDDFITVFPVDSGLPPIYVMFRDPREDAGVATGMGQPVTGIWLGAASQGEGAPIPAQIADQLRGREFRNFREFRETFWKAVANDPELAKQFSSVNLARMAKKGYAPYTIPSEQLGGKVKFELHHVVFLRNNGELYNVDNLQVVTPKEHDALHKNNTGE